MAPVHYRSALHRSVTPHSVAEKSSDYAVMDEKALGRVIKRLEKEMQEHARNLEFEKAGAARDELFKLRQRVFGADQHGSI